MTLTNRSFRFAAFVVFLFQSFQLLLAQQAIRSHQLISGKKEVKVQAVVQDGSRDIWIGTEQGLVKYNGTAYKLFQQKDGLGANSVTALMESADGTIWAGHANGKISLGKDEKFLPFSQKDSTDKERITSIVGDKKGNTWIGTYGSGVYCYDGKTLSRYNSKNGLGDDFVYAISETADGKLWLGTDAGITVIDPSANEKFSYLTTKNGLPDNIVHSLTSGRDGNVWITMRDSGMCKFDLAEKKIIRLSFTGGWKFGSINSMIIDHSGILWIATENSGVITGTVENNKFRRLLFMGHQNSLENEKVSCLFEDSERSIWIGTPKGLAQTFRSRTEFFTTSEGLLSNEVRAILIDSKRFFWISTAAGLSKYWYDDAGTLQRKDYLLNSKTSDIQIVSLFEGKDGTLLAGTYGHGLFLIDPETGSRTAIEEPALASNNVMSICDDKDGHLWLATLGGGISKIIFPQAEYKGKPQVKNYGEEEGVGSIYAYCAFRDSRNILWFGTDGGGLTKLENGKFSSFNSKAGNLKSDIVYSIIEGESGTLWFSTQDAGVYSYDGKAFTNYGTEEGLRDLSPNALIRDLQNNIVVAHGNGVDVISHSGKKIRPYNVYESGSNFNPGQNSICLGLAHDLWIGTDNGMVRFRSELDSLDYLAPKIRFTGLKVELQPYEMNASPEFDYKHNQFVFEFLGILLKAPDKVRYKYKLEGHDKDWSLPTENRMASYPNLPNGEYTFHVAAANAEGIWSEPVSYHFIIKPPFWKTWWFYVLCAVSLAALFYISMKMRVKALQKQNEVLEEKVEERTREVVEQKKIIEEKNNDITSSIRYAKRIQDALLPAKKYMDEHMGDYFVLFKQKDIVSGDFYWVNKKDNKLFFSAIDCTGHGVPGAFVSLVAHGNIQRALIMFHLRTPAGILDRLNEGVTDVLSRGGETSDIKDGMDISLCGLDREAMRLEFSGANHPMLLVRNGELTEIKGDKQPIGQHIFRKNFTNHEMDVKKGDVVYLFSDGYADQFGGQNGKKFKRSKLKELILSMQDKPMQHQKKILDETIENWRGNLEQIDDILVMGLRI